MSGLIIAAKRLTKKRVQIHFLCGMVDQAEHHGSDCGKCEDHSAAN
jgi:hypothetical protein